MELNVKVKIVRIVKRNQIRAKKKSNGNNCKYTCSTIQGGVIKWQISCEFYDTA